MISRSKLVRELSDGGLVEAHELASDLTGGDLAGGVARNWSQLLGAGINLAFILLDSLRVPCILFQLF